MARGLDLARQLVLYGLPNGRKALKKKRYFIFTREVVGNVLKTKMCSLVIQLENYLQEHGYKKCLTDLFLPCSTLTNLKNSFVYSQKQLV